MIPESKDRCMHVEHEGRAHANFRKAASVLTKAFVFNFTCTCSTVMHCRNMNLPLKI